MALGTSLPELVTAITSLAKGHGSLSLGNVIGANVFNLVLVSGMSITVSPFSIPQNSTIMGINSSLVMDLPVMFAVMLLLTVPALLKGRLSRWQGRAAALHLRSLLRRPVCNVSLCAGDPARLHAGAGALGQKTVLRKASSSVKCGDAFFLSLQQGLIESPAGCEIGRNPVIKRQLGRLFSRFIH